MEAMLLFLTDDFQDSWYCHQKLDMPRRGVPYLTKAWTEGPPALFGCPSRAWSFGPAN